MLNFDKYIAIDLINMIKALEKVGVAAIITDSRNSIANMNESAEALTGWAAVECKGLDLYDVIALKKAGNQTLLVSKDNREYCVDINITAYNDDSGREPYQVVLISNKTYENEMNRLLAVSENNLRVIFDSMYDAIIVHDLQGNILDTNKKMLEMYCVANMDITKLTIMKDLSADNNPFEKLPEIWDQVVAGENKLFEWTAKRPCDQSTFEVEVYLTRIALHQQDAILATVRDISQKKKAEQMIQYLSFHDKLTGLYNRAFFEKELLRLDTERQFPISIIMADVNGLKLANDAFGHLAGDELLKNAGEVFRKVCRKEDIVARWGGDEFIAILTRTDLDTASQLCDRIYAECSRVDPKPIMLSMGLGYATKTDALQDIFKTIKEAETLMYANKLTESRENKRKIIGSILEKSVNSDHDIASMMKLCFSLAKAYGLEETRLEQIKLLANIHDIGKASIPAEILNKPGRLNEDEWEIVKKHSEIGYRIASTYPEYANLADDILSHHERWDGSGYPRGLKGREIPVGARILSIVDAYDAMTSDRSYKAAISREEALREIERCGGTQFDPDIARLFVETFSQW